MESGTVVTKKRIANSPQHTYGDLYINDKVFTVKKAIYDVFKIGDVVEFSYTDHVSFSGVQFHNLSHIEKINHENLIFNSSVKTTLATPDEIQFYDAQTSRFFFWINVGFVSFVFFFVEMYFIARFGIDVEMESIFGKSYFLVIMFLCCFSFNFMIFTRVLKLRKMKKLQALEKTSVVAEIIEYVQNENADTCEVFYLFDGQKQQQTISMETYHKIKKNRLVEISFLNHHCFYQLTPVPNVLANN
jgi:hypothetical protein